jgi:hypothetical protein
MSNKLVCLVLLALLVMAAPVVVKGQWDRHDI